MTTEAKRPDTSEDLAVQEHEKHMALDHALAALDTALRERDEARRQLQIVQDMLIEWRREYRPPGMRGNLITATDCLVSYADGLGRVPSYEKEQP